MRDASIVQSIQIQIFFIRTRKFIIVFGLFLWYHKKRKNKTLSIRRSIHILLISTFPNDLLTASIVKIPLHALILNLNLCKNKNTFFLSQ